MITGSLVELITPLFADHTPDYRTLEGLVDWHAAEGSAALILGSAASGAAALDLESRSELLRRAVWQAEGRLKVIADLGAVDVQAALEIAAAASDIGASGLLFTVPATADPTRPDVLRHVERIVEDAALPLLVRNRFDRPAPPAAAEVGYLARMRGVAGFIECSADPARARALLGTPRPDGMALYAGLDETACRLVLDGFAGALSVTANVAPGAVSRMIAAARAGDIAGAETIDVSLRALHEVLLGNAGGLPLRWALIELGLLPEDRLPTALPESIDYAHVRRAMRTAHVLA